jgi:hypothetical protein
MKKRIVFGGGGAEVELEGEGEDVWADSRGLDLVLSGKNVENGTAFPSSSLRNNEPASIRRRFDGIRSTSNSSSLISSGESSLERGEGLENDS